MRHFMFEFLLVVSFLCYMRQINLVKL